MTSDLMTWEQKKLKHGSRTAKPSISIVIPALNEESAIAGTIAAVPSDRLRDAGYDVEILVVDNGSEDRTAELASEAGARVVTEPRRGYGRAYKTGFAHAAGQIIATADADQTYPVEDIPFMVRLLEARKLDFITTNRYAFGIDGAMSRQHKIGNAILNFTTRRLYGVELRDSQSGMWVFRKEILKNMALKSDGMAFSQELKIEACNHAGCQWLELPISYSKRVGTVKLRSWRDGMGNLLHLIMKRVWRGRPGSLVFVGDPTPAPVDEKAFAESRVGDEVATR